MRCMDAFVAGLLFLFTYIAYHMLKWAEYDDTPGTVNQNPLGQPRNGQKVTARDHLRGEGKGFGQEGGHSA